GDYGVAVVVEPVDQWPDRGIFLILDHGGVIEGAQQIPARLKLAQQPLVIDVEAERLGGRVKVGALYEQRGLLLRRGHAVFSRDQNQFGRIPPGAVGGIRGSRYWERSQLASIATLGESTPRACPGKKRPDRHGFPPVG